MADPLDKLVAEVARRQLGNVTRRQLLELGLTDDSIARRVRHGWLHRVHHGVYAVGTRPVTPLERASAAVLACGPGAVLSHLAAAKLWGFVKDWPRTIDVIVPVDRRPRGIRTHVANALKPADRRHHMGIWVTSPERTVLDCAPAFAGLRLTRFVNDARLSHFLQPNSFIETLLRFPKHPGAAPLWAIRFDPHDAPTRSMVEDFIPVFCNQFDLPQPRLNAMLDGYEVDALWPEERVVYEIDGYLYHSDRETFESDRNKDADLLAIDHVTVRGTWRRLTTTPEREATRLEKILQSRRR